MAWAANLLLWHSQGEIPWYHVVMYLLMDILLLLLMLGFSSWAYPFCCQRSVLNLWHFSELQQLRILPRLSELFPIEVSGSLPLNFNRTWTWPLTKCLQKLPSANKLVNVSTKIATFRPKYVCIENTCYQIKMCSYKTFRHQDEEAVKI